ncbi:MAG TPA: hypothetical protein VHS36_02670 [Candidatus Limnocylindrales bacterium]|nr:hypothetical protein [Candidatus Limnocylindrales bacterium]
MRDGNPRLPRFAILVMLVAGCGSGPPPTSSPASAVAATAVAAPSMSVGSSPAVAAASSPGAPAASGLTVAADPTLLALVPGQIDGRTVAYDATSTTTTAEDPTLAARISGLAIATVDAPAASGSPGLAVVTVARLRDPALDDTWFRSWRDTYDSAVCTRAGGVSRHAETTINGRTTFIGTCAGGVFTYHVHVAESDAIVTVMSIGSPALAEKVIEGIKP